MAAMAEAPTAPLTAGESSEVGAQVRAFGSFAQEVMDTGVAGIVAMRYILYVETAKRFVADLYAALAQGLQLPRQFEMRLGAAAEIERKLEHGDVGVRKHPHQHRPGAVIEAPVLVRLEMGPAHEVDGRLRGVGRAGRGILLLIELLVTVMI